MTVKELIEELEKYNPEAEARIADLDYNTYPIDYLIQKWEEEVEIQML